MCSALVRGEPTKKLTLAKELKPVAKRFHPKVFVYCLPKQAGLDNLQTSIL
jgi:hypothetical protein